MISCFWAFLNFKTLQVTVRRYLYREIRYMFSTTGGNGTARASDGPMKIRWENRLNHFSDSNLCEANFCHVNNTCFFNSNSTNQILVTIYKDSEPQTFQTIGFKHFFHQTLDTKQCFCLLWGVSELKTVQNRRFVEQKRRETSESMNRILKIQWTLET